MRVAPAPLPAGVRRLHSAGDAANVPIYRGVSYCDAVRRASAGQALRVVPGSIKVCHWSPVVLGLKAPEGAFEVGLSPRLPYPHAGLLLAPLDSFPGEPEVVIVRAPADRLRALLQATAPIDLWDGHAGRLDRSALPLLLDGHSAARGQGRVVRGHVIAAVNHTLAALAPLPAWQALTRRLFRSHAVTVAFEVVVLRFLANMSICRNSTVIPLLTRRANASFFCTGGITWGLNPPSHATSGWPFSLYQSLTPNSPIPQSPIPAPRYPLPDTDRTAP